jgi:uncharacterized delta-60 repeat protein
MQNQLKNKISERGVFLMKYRALLLGFVFLLSFGIFAGPLEAQHGIVTTPIGTGDDVGYSIKVQADGKIVVGGYYNTATYRDFVALRYHADLGLDNSFDTDGIAPHAIWGNDDAESLIIQPDGKILLAGATLNGTDWDWFIVRYETDGDLDTIYLETASDDWFVDLNSDGLPEMAIGRLPVRTLEEANTIVSKIIGYEGSGVQKVALLVADRKEKDDFDFEVASEEVRSLLPSSIVVRKIFRSQFSDDGQARGVLLSSINQGPLLVNFIGHGSVRIWRGILTSEDIENLTNRGLPLFINMTCLNGFFQDPYMESLAEVLLKSGSGGAKGVWTSSGLTEPDKQAVMNKELIKLLFGRESFTLGEATAKAKASISDQDVRKTWILFGDPTKRLK